VAPKADPACVATYQSLSAAVTAAAPDATIELAAGTYSSGLTIAKALNIVGAGAGSVTTAADPATQTVVQGSLTLDAGGSLTALRVLGSSSASGAQTPPAAVELGYAPDGSYPLATTSYALQNMVAIGATAQIGAFTATADGLDVVAKRPLTVTASGGGFAGVYASGPGVALKLSKTLANGPASCAVQSAAGAAVQIVDSIANGGACGSGLTILRSGLFGQYGLQETDTAASSAVTVRDSLLVGASAAAQIGENPALGGPPPAGKATLTAVGSTFVADGAAGSTAPPEGALIVRSPGASVTLRNTIARLIAPPAPEPDPRADIVALDQGDDVTASSSAFTSAVAAAGATVSRPGTGGNVKGDPRLRSPTTGDYSLAPGSPLIDRGNPAFVSAGELDLDGHPRSLDGLLDCIALPDIGALEFVAHGRCTPLVTKLALSRATVSPKRPAIISFTLARAATVTLQVEPVRPHAPARPGAKLARRLRAGRRELTLSNRLGAATLPPGSYELIVTAVSGTGPQSRPLTARFRVKA
jgi:hypothetical protein